MGERGGGRREQEGGGCSGMVFFRATGQFVFGSLAATVELLLHVRVTLFQINTNVITRDTHEERNILRTSTFCKAARKNRGKHHKLRRISTLCDAHQNILSHAESMHTGTSTAVSAHLLREVNESKPGWPSPLLRSWLMVNRKGQRPR